MYEKVTVEIELEADTEDEAQRKLTALKLDEYAVRKPRRPASLQEALFPYLEAL